MKRKYFSINTGSQDCQKLYEPFPDLFGSFRDNMFFEFCWPLSGPISCHIGSYWTNFDHFWDQKSEHVYVYAIWLYGYKAIWLYGGWIWSVFIGWDEPSFPPTHIPGIYGPGIYGYLWTRYPWVSVDQFSLGPGPAPWPRPFSLGPGPARAPLMEADRASRRVFLFSKNVRLCFLKWCLMCFRDKVLPPKITFSRNT